MKKVNKEIFSIEDIVCKEGLQINYNVKIKFLSFVHRAPFLKRLIYLYAPLGKKIINCDINVSERIVEYSWVLQNLGLLNGKILDIGCCESNLLIKLASLGYVVYGVDTREYPLHHPNFTFVKQDVCNMDFPNNFFDRIIAVSTIEHIGLGAYGYLKHNDGDKKAVKELSRVLKRGGKMLITVPFSFVEPETTIFQRVYDNASLNALFLPYLKIETKKYFLEENGNWMSVSEKRDANTPFPHAIASVITSKE